MALGSDGVRMNGKANWLAIATLALALLGTVWTGAARMGALEQQVDALAVERVAARLAVLESSVNEVNRKLDRIDRRLDWRPSGGQQ